MSNIRFIDKDTITAITGVEFMPITDETNDYKVEVDELANYYTIPTIKSNVSTNTLDIQNLEGLVSTNTIDITSIENVIGTTTLTTSSQIIKTAINEVHVKSLINTPVTPFSVNSAKVNASGYADFTSKVDNTSVVHYAGGSNPNIVETDVLGRTHTITADETITGMTNNGVYEMLKEYDLATGEAVASAPMAVLTANVSEAQVLPSAGAGNDGKYITITGVQPNRQYKGVSSAWVETTFIRRGQVTKTAGTMGTPISYAFGYNQFNAYNLGITQNLSGSGWTKLPNGLILQWGTGMMSGTTAVNTLFPVAFPVGCLMVVAVERSQNSQDYNINTTNITASGFCCRKGNGNDFQPFGYITIGY